MPSGHYPTDLTFPGRYPGPGDGSFPGRYPDISSGLPPPPGTALWWFDPRSVDGQLNATMVDGQQIGTYTNLGSLGSAGNAIQATGALKPTFKLVGAAGKLNNTPTILCTPTQWLQTANVAVQTQPNLICFVGNPADGATRTFVDGNDAVNRNDTFSSAGVWEEFAGTALYNSTLAATAGLYHVVCSLFNGVSSTIRVNKTTSVAGTSPGAASLDGLSIGVAGDATSPCSGQIGAILVYGGGVIPSQASIDAWYDAAFGSIWPQ